MGCSNYRTVRTSSLADSEISEAAAVSAIAFSTQLVVMPLDTDLATKAVD